MDVKCLLRTSGYLHPAHFTGTWQSPQKNAPRYGRRGVENAGKIQARLTWRWRAARRRTYLFFRNFRGRITQSANSPTKAIAATMAIILGLPPGSFWADGFGPYRGLRVFRLIYKYVNKMLRHLRTQRTPSHPGASQLGKNDESNPATADPVSPSARSPSVSVYL